MQLFCKSSFSFFLFIRANWSFRTASKIKGEYHTILEIFSAPNGRSPNEKHPCTVPLFVFLQCASLCSAIQEQAGLVPQYLHKSRRIDADMLCLAAALCRDLHNMSAMTGGLISASPISAPKPFQGEPVGESHGTDSPARHNHHAGRRTQTRNIGHVRRPIDDIQLSYGQDRGLSVRCKRGLCRKQFFLAQTRPERPWRKSGGQ